jgi:uncharacterized protein YjiS (DUF1127 family)
MAMSPSQFERSRGFLQAPLEALARAVDRRRRRRRDILVLAAMSDPELRDIGISRCDVPAVVEGTYRRGSRGISPRAGAGTGVAVPAGRRRSRPKEEIDVSGIR